MDAVAKAISRAISREVDVEDLKVMAIFCGIGLVVSIVDVWARSL
jgi:hypothetical protein